MCNVCNVCTRLEQIRLVLASLHDRVERRVSVALAEHSLGADHYIISIYDKPLTLVKAFVWIQAA